jgi:hypothetical protein
MTLDRPLVEPAAVGALGRTRGHAEVNLLVMAAVPAVTLAGWLPMLLCGTGRPQLVPIALIRELHAHRCSE